MDYQWGWRTYVPIARRRGEARRKLDQLRQKGRAISPVVIEGRTIAKTFWGKAWCENLERYSDFRNRLARGRTYLRTGSVIDLQIGAGQVQALVSGSRVYKIAVNITPVSKARWKAICKDCAGAIESVIELLQGRLSQAVMERICREKAGLFPTPQEIQLSCSCPDWAVMCKHVAAVLYGIGARLDEEPELLFRLHQLDEKELITTASAAMPLSKKPPSNTILESSNLAELFGLDLAEADISVRRRAGTKARSSKPRRKKIRKTQ